MATTNYAFPTIQASDEIDGVSAINGLANAVDASLKELSDSIEVTGGYVLPAASTSALGGVIVGTGLSVTPTGTLNVDTTWLTQQIDAAIAAYFAANVHTADTWGELASNGFAYVGANF